MIHTSNVNDYELLMPSGYYHFWKKNEPRPSRDSSQMTPSRTDTLAKRAQTEPRL